MNDIEKCIIDLKLRSPENELSELSLLLKQIESAEQAQKTKTDGKKNLLGDQTNPDSGIDNSKEKEEFQETIFVDTSNKQTKKKIKLAVSSVIIATLLVFAFAGVFMNKSKTLTGQEKTTVKSKEIQNRAIVSLPENKNHELEDSALEALQEKRFYDAVKHFEDHFAKNPMEDKLKQSYIKALLGLSSESVEQESEIVQELLLKAITVDPACIEGHFQLAQIYTKSNDYVHAKKSYQKIIELDKNFVDAFFNLGYIYAVDKDYKNAEIMYQKAVDLNPPYLDEALFNLSIMQDKLGKRKQVAQNLKRAFSINPDNAMVKKYLEKFHNKNGEQ